MMCEGVGEQYRVTLLEGEQESKCGVLLFGLKYVSLYACHLIFYSNFMFLYVYCDNLS